MIYVTMLGYNSAEMVEGAMKNFDETVEMRQDIVKSLFLLGYPLPSKEENKKLLLALADKYGWVTHEIPNVSVMENWNVAIHEVHKLREGDYLCCFDADVRMQQRGWLPAMVEVLEANPRAVFVCAARPFHDEAWCVNQHGRQIHVLPSGTRFATYRELIAWSTGLWKGDWLSLRPRDFAAAHPVYGWAEMADLERMAKYGKGWVSMVDHLDDHQSDKCDPLYTEWKRACAENRTQDKFDDWLTHLPQDK